MVDEVSPTELTLRELRKRPGVVPWRTEHWNSFARIRQDLFGFVDVLAVGGEHGTLGVQCTSDSNVAARVRKIKESPILPVLLEADWKIEVWGWKKKAGKYVCRVVPVDLQHWIVENL